MTDLADVALRVVSENQALLKDGGDFGLGIFVTPGPYATLAPDKAKQPSLCVYAYPLPFFQWAAKYTEGQALAISKHRQVPTSCWPAELKCRSRMHYHLADIDAARRFPGARAVLLDQQGFLSEASTASVIVYRETEGIVTPRSEKILPGISLMTLLEIATEMEIDSLQRDVPVEELRTADEVWLASTSVCLLPATTLDGAMIGTGRPGPIFKLLLSAWNERAGIDIAEQARRFAVSR
jgi:branched-subunit amino acid aminotransferase/4-amino-4-deoxychorismate lyase